MDSSTKLRDLYTDHEQTPLQNMQRVRPFAPLTTHEKWRLFVNQPTAKIAAILILCVTAGGYYFGTRTNSATSLKFPISSSESFKTSTSTTVKTQIIKVYVSGAVKSPGVIELDASSRVTDAISAAGGLKNVADLSKCNLAAFLSDGSSIRIPSKSSTNPSDCGESTSITSSSGAQSGPTLNTGAKINLNTASQSEIETLPGIGPTMGAAIISYRADHGSFSSINDLRKVKGIGDKRFADLKDLVTI